MKVYFLNYPLFLCLMLLAISYNCQLQADDCSEDKLAKKYEELLKANPDEAADAFEQYVVNTCGKEKAHEILDDLGEEGSGADTEEDPESE